MKLEDINETVFQTLSPEVQQALMEVSQTAESNDYTIIGITATILIPVILGMLLID